MVKDDAEKVAAAREEAAHQAAELERTGGLRALGHVFSAKESGKSWHNKVERASAERASAELLEDTAVGSGASAARSRRGRRGPIDSDYLAFIGSTYPDVRRASEGRVRRGLESDSLALSGRIGSPAPFNVKVF